MSGTQHYRVIETRYPEFVKRMNEWRGSGSGAETCWLACDLDDSVSFTFPIFDRELAPSEDRRRPEDLQETKNRRGERVYRWRAGFTVWERFAGRWDCQLLHAGDTRQSHHRWAGTKLEWQLPMEALVLATTDASPLEPAVAATLRRLLENALHVLTRLEPHAVAVHVLEHLGDCAPDGVDEDTSAIVILAPFNGEAGLLNALGAFPWRLVNGLLLLTWHWADYLASDAIPVPTWEHIGFMGSLVGDDRYQPAPASCRDYIAKLLGELEPTKDVAVASTSMSAELGPEDEDEDEEAGEQT